MQPRVATPVLWVRAVFAGSFAFVLGLAGHAVGDGPVPGPALLVVLFALTVVACVPLLRRPASAPRMLILQVGGQSFIHASLVLSVGHPSVAPGGLLQVDVLADLCGHLVAAALVAVWLAHGERRVFTALQLAARRLLTLARPAVLVTVRLARGTTQTPVVGVGFRDFLLGRAVSRRGPPTLLA